MSLDKYFEAIDIALQNPWVIFVDCQKEKRSTSVGLITGKVIFIDYSEFHFMEYIEVTDQTQCQTYRYHYQDKAKKMIFRHDNAPHHPEISTHPHHKHVGSEILESCQPTLSEIMDEIAQDYLLKAKYNG
ncbi:MAG: DUF6516 family protein [Candidatus Competibacteraceae bacterium]